MKHQTAETEGQTNALPSKLKNGGDSVKKKKIYLELMRALSMLLVIFNHTGTKGFFLFSVATDSILYPFYLFLSVACKIAVPLYWMISGALLLPKEESIKQVYLHRVLRMVLVLVVFSVPYFIIHTVEHHRSIGLRSVFSFLITLYTSRHVPAFWFLYAYIGIMMILPFLRKMVKAMPKSYFHYLFLLVLFFWGILPMAEYLASTLPARIGLPINTELTVYSLNASVTNNLFSPSVLYFIGGYYFDHLLKDYELTKAGAIKWLGAGLAAIIVTCLMTQYMITLTGLSKEGEAQTFYMNLMCIPTFAVFYSIRLLFQKHPTPDRANQVILSFGQCAFGILLCEKALRKALYGLYEALAPTLHTLPACLLWVLAVYISGYVVTLCLKRIPGTKSLI